MKNEALEDMFLSDQYSNSDRGKKSGCRTEMLLGVLMKTRYILRYLLSRWQRKLTLPRGSSVHLWLIFQETEEKAKMCTCRWLRNNNIINETLNIKDNIHNSWAAVAAGQTSDCESLKMEPAASVNDIHSRQLFGCFCKNIIILRQANIRCYLFQP